MGFLDVQPKEMDEFITEAFTNNNFANNKIKRLKFYFAYYNIEDL